jgi:tetratricopeptide (TPR) repeat protein
MFRRILVLSLYFTASLASARDKTETWIQVSSPHFVVVTNSSEKQGRRVADQFKRMRSVFHAAFPKAQIDPGAPIVVLAAKDEKTFRDLEPEAYLAKGSLKLGGLFLRAQDKNYVLLRLDAEGEHPYAIVYHEYTHLLLSKSEDFMPLWMNEGLAEFYQNTEIHEKDASLGQPSRENILWLRQNRLLPLDVLFSVNRTSPYYHEENKGSIFYAQSWALTHYLEMTDFANKSHRMSDYLALVSQQVDPVTAGTRTFGDPKKLQQELESYIRQTSGFRYIKMETTTEVDDSAFKMQLLTGAQSDALRADFLAYNRRTADAEALLDHVLQGDPNNVSAHETKGFLEFQQRHFEEAKTWYAKAVQLDLQSYLAHYYFAAISMSHFEDASDQDQIENSLRQAIKLNPLFAPPFDRLAVFLAMRHENLDEARMMGLTAISLEPANVGYRVNMANVYMTMEKGESAVQVLRNAAKVAKTPEESRMVNAALMHAQEYVEAQARFAEHDRGIADEEKADDGDATVSMTSTAPRLTRQPEFVARGPHRFVEGVLKNVHCDNPALDLTVNSNGKLIALHVDSYLKISFSSLGFQPNKELNPCSDLENRPAKVEYVDSANPSVTAQLISVELHK